MYLQQDQLKEVRMLSQEDYIVIKTLIKHGVYQIDIAAELGVHPKTISRALKRGGAAKKTRAKRGSKLDPYKTKVDELLDEGVWNAVVVFDEIHEMGYEGGMTILREYIQPKRVMRKSKRTPRFETEPGEQLQSDWGELHTEIGGVETKVHFIVNQLGYSRRFHFWCTERQDAEHTYEGLVRSFEYFGGVTETVLVDNQKSTVLEHPVSGGVRFNRRFLDLASHYGFVPRACKPHRPRTKGKDERMVGYIKGNFFIRYRSFESWAHLNQLAERWLSEKADQRVHGTVKEVVAERFGREKSALLSLPAVRYDTAYFELRKVGWDAYIDVRGNRYSVPGELCGNTVQVRIGLDGVLRVFHGEQLVVRHLLRSAREGWVTVPEHHAQLWQEVLQVERRPLEVYEEVA
jgi:transposase